ncbi:MAG: Gfo/Idh/MocA family protein [Anaerolineae bacterium]
MAERVPTAVIGLGMFGALHAQVYAESPLSRLQAVVSRTPNRAREIGERFGARWYTDWREMLDTEKEVRAVSIVNRDAEHKEPAIACAQAGKDILLEKPMAPTLAEVDEIISAVEKAGVRLMVNFTLHFDPTYVAAYEQVQAGEIGDVLTMFARRNGTRGGGYPGQPIPYSQWTNILISTGIHELEALTWYANSRVRRVYGESVKALDRQSLGDDAYFALLKFESGTVGNLETSSIAPPTSPARLDSRFDIIGSKGCIYIENVNARMLVCTDAGCCHPDLSYWPVQRGRAVGALREAMTHFLTCLWEDKEPIVGAKEGRLAVQLVLAVEESCRLGRPVEL